MATINQIELKEMRELDLHGTKHEDVDRIVENFVLLNELPVRIITGNSLKMIELTKKVINKHQLKWEHHNPNFGAMIITDISPKI